MKTALTRNDAIALVREYNQEAFHVRHALTVGKVMRYRAIEAGLNDEADAWEIVGILHDIDFEQWPEQHCKKAPILLEKAGVEPELVHAVCSHGYGLCCDIKPEHEMEMFLFASDELTGLIGAAALMRPSKSCSDMELSSLKKKFKDKKFAAGCSRAVISDGAQLLGWDLDRLMNTTLEAMKASEEELNTEMKELGYE